jgi:two-component system cell cycle sensor histidine kinase/response regulator CckA
LSAIIALLLGCGIAVGALGTWTLGRRQYLLGEALAGERSGRAITDTDGRVLWCNGAFVAIMADDKGEVFAGLTDQAAEDEDSAALLECLKETALAGGASDGEFRMTVGDGSSKWLKIYARPLVGEPGHTLWSVEDVTVQREMGEVIAEERARLVDFLDNAEIGFYAVDGDGVFEFSNRAFGEWVGVPAETLVRDKRRLAEIIGGKGVDPDRPFSPFAKGLPGDHGEATFRRKDGSEFQADVIQTVGGDLGGDLGGDSGDDLDSASGGGPLKARAIVRDLSAEKEFEQILAASEIRFRKLFQDAPAGIAILDSHGVVIDANQAFRRIAAAGKDPSGRSVIELVAPDDRADLEARLAEVVGGRVTNEVLDVRLADSEDGAAALYVTPLEEADGAPLVILHVFDTTQYRRLEEQFTQSQKLQAVGQLAGGIAHDFNNLLTVMIGFCDLILQRHRPGEQTFADIMQIKQNANRAANLVRQLLAFSRQQTLQPKVINITDVLAELSNLLRRLIGVNITLNMVHGRDLGLVKVDQVQLEQVIINLAVNARDAMKDEGGTLNMVTANAEITAPVRCGTDIMPPGRYVSISVKDTGTGIARADLDRIFEPFFSTKEVGAGTGLGLSTVYGIVRQTGGFVRVDSVEGQGTEFTILLPLHEQSEEEKEEAAVAKSIAAAPEPTQDLSGVGTVLLVEDEDPVRLFGARALRNKGYEVLEAKNGEAALEVINQTAGPIDLVISDVVMPQLDGPGLIREVRAQHPDMKVIFISGYAEDDFREALERESDIHFLSKPFSLDQLAGKVKDVLAG